MVAGVVLGVAALAARQPALVVLAVACLAALACSVVTLAVRPRLTLERRLAATRVTAGEAVPVELVVTNTGARPSSSTTALDSLEPAAGPGRVPVRIPAIGARRTRTVRYELPAPRRGVFALPPLIVDRTDPLGLTRIAPLATTDDLTVRVHPRTVAVAPIPAGFQLREEGPLGVDAHQGALVFHSLREYVVGDDIRHIHWRSSAHAGDLLVREHLETTTPTAAVVLDTRAAVHTEASFEAAVEIAASLVIGSLPHGVPVILATTGGLSLRASHAEAALDELAAVDADDGQGRPVDGVAAWDSPAGRRSGLVFVTGAPGPADAGAIAAWCARAAHATVVLVGDRGRAEPGRAGLAGVAAPVLAVEGTDHFAALWNQLLR